MTRYYFTGTPLELTEQETYHLRKYLKRGRAAGTILPWESFDLDLAALRTPVQLACHQCHLAHHVSCCEGGFPFPPESALLPVLDEHVSVILAKYLPPSVGAHVAAKSLYEQHLETAGHPTIGTYEGNCLFCRVEEEGPACMVHRYALDQGMHPAEIKPYSCLLYPLELIEDECGRVFITTLNDATARFSRWGEDYRLDFLCANQELREAVANDQAEQVGLRENIKRRMPSDAFALTAYRPAYVEMRDTLVARYGEALWQAIDQHLS